MRFGKNVSVLWFAIVLALTASSKTAYVITEYAVPTGGSGPGAITSGPDGNIWFTEYNGNNIGKSDLPHAALPVVPGGISGCTNHNAENYNPAATVDDGSCRLTHPDFSGNASTVNVGSVAMNGKASKTITITNSGNGSAWIYSVDISGESFTIVSENCSGKSIQPGKSCEIVIAFDPTAKGAFTGTLKLWSNSGSYRPLAISLSGVGTGSAPSAAELVTPADGESGTGTTVTFTWNLGADNDSGALTHKLFVCEKKDFAGCETPSGTSRTESDTPMGVTILIAGLLAPFGWRNRRKVAVWAIGALLAGGLTISACGGGSSSKVEGSNKQTVSGLKASTTYYWKVTEVTANGSSTDSSVRSFTTGK